MEKNRLRILMLIVVLVTSVMACQLAGSQPGVNVTPAGQGSEPVVEAGASPTPANQLSVPILGGDDTTTTPASTQAGSAPILGNDAGAPAVQPVNVKAEPVRVVQELRDFMSKGNSYAYGKLLVIENPNPDLGIQDTQCQLTAYDSTGAVLETDTCKIGLLFPGERRTIYVAAMMQDKAAAVRLEFVITQQGQPVKTSLTSTSLGSERLKYWPDDGIMTGIVKNDSDYLINMPILTAVFYDEQGQVIAVKKDTFTGFIAPHGQTGVSLSAFTGLKPARMELLVVPDGAWTIEPVKLDHLAPQLTQPLSIKIVDDTKTAVGAKAFFFATNPNMDVSIGDLSAEVTAYDAQGFVLGEMASPNMLPVIFPGEKVGVITEQFSIPHGSSIASVEVQASPPMGKVDLWDYHALGIDKNPLSASNGQYQAQNTEVTCVLKNTWKNPVDSAVAAAVAYDADGKIVGIGSQTAFNVAAGEQANLTIKMVMEINYSGTPARIELFAYATNPTSIH